MIGKCKAVGGSAKGIAYLFEDKQDQSKPRGYELDRNMLIGETPSELLSELKQWNKDNSKQLLNEVFSMVLAPAGDDGKKLTNEELRKLSKEFIAKTLNIDPNKQPYYMRVHDDTENKHVHIYLPRTDYNGKTISDKHCMYRAIDSADKIAQNHNLTRAKEIQKNNIQALEIDRKELKKQIISILHTSKSFGEFQFKSAQKGIEIKPTINKKGEVQGYRILSGKADFKASEIDRNITLPKLESIFKNNILQEQKQSISRNPRIGY